MVTHAFDLSAWEVEAVDWEFRVSLVSCRVSPKPHIKCKVGQD